MTTPGLVFLSAVTSEFGKARDQLAKDLRAAERAEVKVQEEFPNRSGTLLEALADYVDECTAVYAVIGKRSGSLPPAPAAAPYLDELPKDLVEKWGTEWSYTQWEVFFGLHRNRQVVFYRASGEYEPDEKKAPKGDDPKLQKRYMKWLFGKKKGTGRIWSEFDSLKDLQIAAFRTKLDGERVEAEVGEHGASATEKRSKGKVSRRPTEKQNRMDEGGPIIDRREDLAWVAQQIAKEAAEASASKLVMLRGEDGVGRRTILRALSHGHQDALGDGLSAFPHGVAVYPVLTQEENLEDLRQAIWDQFYVGADPSTVKKRSRVEQLKSVEALVFVPGTGHFADLIAQISEEMPKSVICTWVNPEVAGRLAGRRITIDGLPREETDGDVVTSPVLDLFETHYGGAVPAAARDDLLALCDKDADRHVVGARGNPKKIEILAQDAYDETRGSADRLAGWAGERVAALMATEAREGSAG